MSGRSRRPILLLVNPAAGGKPGSGGEVGDAASREPDALADALRLGGCDVTLRVLTQADDPAALAAAAAATSDVVAAGGDGTVGAAAGALQGTAAALGILPLGSYNNVAHGLGIPDELHDAVARIVAGHTRRVDVGLAGHAGAEPRHFLEAAGVGLEAFGFSAVAVSERRGVGRGLRLLLRVLRQRKRAMWLTLDGERLRTRTPSVAVCNMPYHGAGFALSPDADPTDGRLQVVIFEGMSAGRALIHYLRVARRRPVRDPQVVVRTATEVRIEAERGTLPGHADGVSIGLTPIEVRLLPGALRVFG